MRAYLPQWLISKRGVREAFITLCVLVSHLWECICKKAIRETRHNERDRKKG